MPERPLPRMRLGQLALLATALGTLVLSLVLVLFLDAYSKQVSDRALDRGIQGRAQSAGLDLARSIEADWQELRALGDRLGSIPRGTLRGIFTGMVGSGSRVAWVGYTGLDGEVIAASSGLLEGVDVSARPWFRAGLDNGYAGDVRDAVLLNQLLGGTPENPKRFIDLAVPVKDAQGTTIGVLAAHINAAWVERYLAESAVIRSIDLYVVNPAGQVVIATAPVPDSPLSLQTFRAAKTGVATSAREEWPDGQVYRSAVVPSIAYGELPSFGWRLVARIPDDAFATDRRDLLKVALTLMLASAAFVLLGAFLFVRLFVAPLSGIADAALAIGEGKDVYPPESRRSREAAALSAALVLIQTRLRGLR